jgi:hypothetical protein
VDPNQAPKVVQFRSKKLDVELIELARQSYGGFVPECKFHSTMPGDVYVYVWDFVHGTALCRVRRQFFALDIEMEHHLYQIVGDFARYDGTCSTEIFINQKTPDSLLQLGTVGQSLNSLLAYLTSIMIFSIKSPRVCLSGYKLSWMRFDGGFHFSFGQTIPWLSNMTTS